jgi:hypothetical protein
MLYICHCTDCQNLAGSAFGMSMPFRRSALELLAGEPGERTFETTEGIVKGTAYCPECGARVWGLNPKYPDLVIGRPGTLDSLKGLEPIAHIWTDSAQPWVTIPDDLVCYPREPDDLEMVRLFKAAHPDG